jgi:hypothetical protein
MMRYTIAGFYMEKKLTHMTQVSDVASGPLVIKICLLYNTHSNMQKLEDMLRVKSLVHVHGDVKYMHNMILYTGDDV